MPDWSAVDDAVEPCPECDAVAWEAAGDEVRCGGCRFAVTWAASFGLAAPMTDREPVEPEEAAASEAWTAETSRRLSLEEVEALYAVAGAGLPQVVAYGPGHVTLSHGERLRITSGRDDPLPELLANALPPLAPPEDRSRAAFRVWLEVSSRASEALIAGAEPFAHALVVDEQHVTFSGLRAGDAWALATDGIAVTGRGELPRRLQRIVDPVARFA